MAAPGKDGDSFQLDMATSSMALGKVCSTAKLTTETTSVMLINHFLFLSCVGRNVSKKGN